MRLRFSAFLLLLSGQPIAVWGQELTIRQTQELPGALAVSPDFTLYAEKVKTEKVKIPKGIYEFGVRIKEIGSRKEVKTLEWDKDWGNPFDASFAPDGKRVSIRCGVETAKIFDVQSGEMQFNLTHPLLELVAFTPNSKKVASAGGAGAANPKDTLWIWDLHTKKRVVAESPTKPTCIALSPDNKLVVVAHGRYIRAYPDNPIRR